MVFILGNAFAISQPGAFTSLGKTMSDYEARAIRWQEIPGFHKKAAGMESRSLDAEVWRITYTNTYIYI